MGNDKQNLNSKGRKKLKEFIKLYHPETKIIVYIKPKGQNSWILFHSDIHNKSFKNGFELQKAINNAEFPN